GLRPLGRGESRYRALGRWLPSHGALAPRSECEPSRLGPRWQIHRLHPAPRHHRQPVAAAHRRRQTQPAYPLHRPQHSSFRLRPRRAPSHQPRLAQSRRGGRHRPRGRIAVMTRSVGPFEIVENRGAGGMGEVFKARDTRLNRFVALKFLPEGAGAAARDRFRREAQAIAALNHPHICTLYEVGDDNGQPYLVMELLEGETLHARLARGTVASTQAIAWGAEIADALQAAHAKGILHRDLKPGNIFLTQRGDIKVLDFGLAQFALTAASDPDAPTAVSPGAGPLTSPGSTLGTYAYMSPEQARGEPTDARSDLFSLGVVL